MISMDYTTKSLNFQRMRIVWWLPTKKLTSELFIVRNVNQSLQNRIINLENQQFTQNNTTDLTMLKYLRFQMKFQIEILNKQ